MNRILPLIAILIVIAGCSSESTMRGEVVSSKAIGQGVTELLVQTKNDDIPYFKIRTNKSCFQKGSKVVIDLP